jgi:putative two-component system response regulator
MPADPSAQHGLLATPGTQPIEGLRIVVLDDNGANVALLEAMLASWRFTDVTGLTSGVRALELCRSEEVDLLLLDLHMPDLDGLAILRELAPRIKAPVALPVIVLTGQSGPETKHEALDAGARDFLVKPFDAGEVRLRIRNALELRSLQLAQRGLQRDLAERVRQRTAELDASRYDVVERLARAGEFRDDATGEHTRRVGRTTAKLAKLCGVRADLVRDLELAAPLHDIGKLAVPDAVLLKPGPLTPEEFAVVKSHARIGAELLAGSSSSLLELASEIALTHHERWDGQGYPANLAGDAIPFAGRLTAIADVFDALTHDRPYKPAWEIGAAIDEMTAHAGRQFDPAAFEAFLELDHATLV